MRCEDVLVEGQYDRIPRVFKDVEKGDECDGF